MSEPLTPDAVGPVDVAVIMFEGNTFNGNIAPALAELHGNGTVRILDLAFVLKSQDGNTRVVEVEDADVAEMFAAIQDDPVDLLNDSDLEQIASELDPDTSALVVVWENTWAAQMADAVRKSNARLAAMIRIPHEVVVAAVAAAQEEE